MATAAGLGSGAALVWSGMPASLTESTDAPVPTDDLQWVRALADVAGTVEMKPPGQQLREHPVAKHFVEQGDPLVSDNIYYFIYLFIY